MRSRWLVDCILQHFDTIHRRVVDDVSVQRLTEDREKEKRKERIQTNKEQNEPTESTDSQPIFQSRMDNQQSVGTSAHISKGDPFRPVREVIVRITQFQDFRKWINLHLCRFFSLKRNRGIFPVQWKHTTIHQSLHNLSMTKANQLESRAALILLEIRRV